MGDRVGYRSVVQPDGVTDDLGYYDVLNDSRWTPFAGAGIGWAATELNYDLQFIRKPEAEYLQIEFDPDWPNVAKRAAAGTASILDTYAGTTRFGYQALVGVDYELSERTALGAALRWTRFDDIDHEAVYHVVRSHAGVLADGVTPFNNELEFSGIGSQALSTTSTLTTLAAGSGRLVGGHLRRRGPPRVAGAERRRYGQWLTWWIPGLSCSSGRRWR